MDWGTIITGAIITGIGGFFAWFTQKYLPDRDKRLEANILRQFQRDEGIQNFNETSEKTSLERILAQQEELITANIAAANGHIEKLAGDVAKGFKDILEQQTKMNTIFKVLLVLMSRSKTQPEIEGDKDRGEVSEVMSAVVEAFEEGVSLSDVQLTTKKE